MSNKDEATSQDQLLQLTIVCDPLLTESISDYLIGVLGAGVEAGVNNRAEKQILHAFVAVNASPAAEIEAQVRTYGQDMAAIFGVAEPTVQAAFMVDEDWAKNWQKFFKPFAIIPGVVIAPTWEHYVGHDSELVIEMDPGMAFGTGHHDTTSLCVELIAEVLAENQGGTVLDVGTGTGILGMAAALLSGVEVLGIDNDPEAVAAARENVRKNGLEAVMSVAATPLAEVKGTYTLVVANIIHDVLLAMADDLARLVAPGGSLILSGILQGEQTENIATQFAGRGLSLVATRQRGEWAALCFQAPR